jgi:phage protein U
MLGRYGSLNFICNDKKVQTFNGLSRSRDIRYATHDLIGKMPMLEFVGYGLYKASFTMRFDLSLGVSPAACLAKLQRMMNNKQYKWLMIGGEFVGRYVIESIEEERRIHAGDGLLLVAEAKVNLIEWSRGK